MPKISGFACDVSRRANRKKFLKLETAYIVYTSYTSALLGNTYTYCL